MRIWAMLGLVILASCGVAGDPVTPELFGNTTIGVNSNSGVYSGTEIGIRIGN